MKKRLTSPKTLIITHVRIFIKLSDVVIAIKINIFFSSRLYFLVTSLYLVYDFRRQDVMVWDEVQGEFNDCAVISKTENIASSKA